MTPVPETAAAIARGTPAPPHVLGAHSERGPRHAEANNGYPQRQSLRRGLPVTDLRVAPPWKLQGWPRQLGDSILAWGYGLEPCPPRSDIIPRRASAATRSGLPSSKPGPLPSEPATVPDGDTGPVPRSGSPGQPE